MRFPRRLNLLAARPDRFWLMRFASFRWAALPITDRRWTAPMAAAALGFGIFAGVAIGPGTEGSRGADGPVMVQLAPTPDDAPAPALGKTPGNSTSPASSGPDFDSPSGDLGSQVPDVSGTSFETPSYTPTPVPPAVSATPQTQTDDPATDGEPVLTAFAGTIVGINPRAGSYTIADEAGALSSIHTIELPNIADVIEVEARTLANGTYDEGSIRKRDGRRKRVSLTGSVTYREPVANGYTVSGVGSSLFVTVGPDTPPPPLGAEVEVTARFIASPIEAEFETAAQKGEQKRAEPAIPGCGPSGGRPGRPALTLREKAVDVVTEEDLSDDELSAPVQLEGIVQGVCHDERKLIVSADDVDASGADITLNAPADILLKEIDAGEAVLATAVITDAGIYRLTALASDDRAKRADDAELIQTAGAAQ